MSDRERVPRGTVSGPTHRSARIDSIAASIRHGGNGRGRSPAPTGLSWCQAAGRCTWGMASASGRKEWAKIEAEIIPRVSGNFGQSLSHGLWPCQLPLHKGAFGDGDADCRVASLLAMTVLNLCHSEEAQRADVGIRPFYDGRWFGPPRSSAPTEGLPKSQQRANVGIGPYGTKREPAAIARAAL